MSVATLLRASFFERPWPMKFSPSTIAPTVCMMLGVIPCDPRSEYCVTGRMIDKSITGCIVELFGGSSVRTFATLGGLNLTSAAAIPVPTTGAIASMGCRK